MDEQGNIYKISSEDLTTEELVRQVEKHDLHPLSDEEAKHLQGMNRAERRAFARKMGWFIKKNSVRRNLKNDSQNSFRLESLVYDLDMELSRPRKYHGPTAIGKIHKNMAEMAC